MRKIFKIGIRILVASLVIGVMVMGSIPALAAQPLPPPGVVTYVLYATDGWIYMADGTPVYIYGYVGGIEGQTIQYLQYPKTIDAGGTQIATGLPATLSAATVVPAPTAGAITAGELPFFGNAQLPAPLIRARVGDTVIIKLKNLGVSNPSAPNDPHTIHLHGADVNAANDGVPETSIATIPAAQGAWNPGTLAFDPVTNNTPLGVAGAAGFGNVVVYEWTPTVAGTYFYHCHQEADIHVQMGMYGGINIYNPRDTAAATGTLPGVGSGVLSGFRWTKEYVELLTEVDVNQHLSEQFALSPTPAADAATFMAPYASPGATVLDASVGTVSYAPNLPFNPADYHPQYWLVNGLSFPHTIHTGGAGAATFADWLAAHPGWDPFIQGSASLPDKVLVRFSNLGFETQPMHMHGYHAKVISKDQRAISWANPPGMPTGKGWELNTLLIGSGEAYDLLYDFGTQALAGTYNPGVYSRFNPADNTPQLDSAVAFPAIPDPFTGGVYLTSPVANLFPFHNHDDYKSTNNGVYPGGQFTALNVLP